jgi:hypothetical protein
MKAELRSLVAGIFRLGYAAGVLSWHTVSSNGESSTVASAGARLFLLGRFGLLAIISKSFR